MHKVLHKNVIFKKKIKQRISLDLTFKKNTRKLSITCQEYIFIIHEWSKELQDLLLLLL